MTVARVAEDDVQTQQPQGTGPGRPAEPAPARPPADPVAELRTAFGLLTRFPVGMGDMDRSGSAAFPVVGAVLGLIAAIPLLLLAEAAPLLAATLALGILAIASGVLHLDGLADTADALVAPTPERAETARKDPRIGTAGAVALLLVLVADAGAMTAIPPRAILAALLVAGAVSRAIPPIAAIAFPARDAAPADGFGAWFTAHSGPGGAATAVILAVLAGVAAWAQVAAVTPVHVAPWHAAVGTLGAAGGGLAAGLVLAAWLRGRFGRLAGDFHGAAIEIAFLASLATSAIAWGVR